MAAHGGVRQTSVDFIEGSNELRLSKNFTVSARKEYNYMIYKAICGTGSCCYQFDEAVYFMWKWH